MIKTKAYLWICAAMAWSSSSAMAALVQRASRGLFHIHHARSTAASKSLFESHYFYEVSAGVA